MAGTLIFTDGVHNWDPDTRLSKGWDRNNVYVDRSLSVVRRPGTASLYARSSAEFPRLTLANALSTLYLGSAVRLGYFSTTGWRFRSPSGYQLTVNVESDGSIAVRSGDYDGTVLAQTVAGVMELEDWTYIEIKLVIDGSSGAVEVRKNGVTTPILTYSGDTQEQTESNVTEIWFAGQAYYTDFYIDTAQFHGNVTIDTLYPRDDGNYTDMTPSAGTNVSCVDDEAGANTSDYVEADTVGEKDTYPVGPMDVDGHVIKAVNHYTAAWQTDIGTIGYDPVTRIGTTDYNGVEANTTTTIKQRWDIQETSPATATAWTESEINAAEFGIEITEIS